MKTTIALIALSGMLAAQETRREIVKPASTPAEDAKANSDKVPDVFAIKGQFDRIVILRRCRTIRFTFSWFCAMLWLWAWPESGKSARCSARSSRLSTRHSGGG